MEQFDREFQSLDAATEKRRAAMSMLCWEQKEDFVLMIVTNTTDYMGGSDEQGRQVDDEKLPNTRDLEGYFGFGLQNLVLFTSLVYASPE